jgi:hypothetical protein
VMENALVRGRAAHPGNSDAPVAMKQPAPTSLPFTWTTRRWCRSAG